MNLKCTDGMSRNFHQKTHRLEFMRLNFSLFGFALRVSFQMWLAFEPDFFVFDADFFLDAIEETVCMIA